MDVWSMMIIFEILIKWPHLVVYTEQLSPEL